MPTLHQLQSDAVLTNEQLAQEAGISLNSLRKMKRGESTAPFVVGKVVRVLSEKLGYKIQTSDIEGLNIS